MSDDGFERVSNFHRLCYYCCCCCWWYGESVEDFVRVICHGLPPTRLIDDDDASQTSRDGYYGSIAERSTSSIYEQPRRQLHSEALSGVQEEQDILTFINKLRNSQGLHVSERQRQMDGAVALLNHVSTGLACSICMESLKKRSICSTTCGHVFCEKCIGRHLNEYASCPICTRPLNPLLDVTKLYLIIF